MTELSAQPETGDLLECLTTFRQAVLRGAAEVVSKPLTDDTNYRADAFPRVAAMLASSLEELRVAEEQLAEQGAALAVRQHDFDRRLDYERRLFDLAPAVLLSTDLMGSITDANRAATTFFGKEMYHLDGKPIVCFVPLPERTVFREQLRRMTIADGASDWRFHVTRPRDVPVAVSAAVRLVGRGHPSGGAALFWALRVV